MILPYLVANDLPGLRIIPQGVKEEWDRQTRCISDYSFTSINSKFLPSYALSSMPYGWDLDRLIIEVVILYQYLRPIYVLKAILSNGIYRITLWTEDA